MTHQTPKIALLGVTGYAGAELARLLVLHPRLAANPPVFFGREGSVSVELTEIHPEFRGLPAFRGVRVQPFDPEALSAREIDLLVLATPHEQSRTLAPLALAEGIKVLDLSGAWRLRRSAGRAVYGFAEEGSHGAEQIHAMAQYGIPELHRVCIREARLVANPGCYATSAILPLKPLLRAGWVDREHGVVCDSKSGVSGAGKAPTATTHFMHVADNLSAYGLFSHRHMGELVEQLDLPEAQIIFTPHLLPVPRGILSTIYVRLLARRTPGEIEDCLLSSYRESPLVRIAHFPQLPEMHHSVGTPFADIGFALAEDGQRLILISCLDNLLKGAASQALQNLNLMCGWEEAEGLL